MLSCYLAIIILYLVGLFIVVSYFILRWLQSKTNSFDDPLYSDLGILPGGRANVWLLSHFILYFILGFLFPFCDGPIIVTGIIWELIETLFGWCFGPVIRRNEKGNLEKTYWWQGSVVDIITNIIGFYIGKGLRFYVEPRLYEMQRYPLARFPNYYF